MAFLQDTELFKKLWDHLTHRIVLVWYGPEKNPQNISIECESCNEVLIDVEREG